MVSVNREEMDRAVDDHFRFEVNDDVEEVLGSLADGVEHEVIPSPFGTHGDAAKIRAYYEMLFASLEGEGATPVRRLSAEQAWLDLAALRSQLGRAQTRPHTADFAPFVHAHAWR
jgi:hypothetical protein